MRIARTLTLAAAAFAISVTAASAQSTTRIETRPFYGATVTLEEGVRVFRPLPPDRNVIINPEGQTPLALGFNETNVYERRVIKNYNYNESSAGTPRYVSGRAYGPVYGPGFYNYNGYSRSAPHVGGHGPVGGGGYGHGGGGHGGGGH